MSSRDDPAPVIPFYDLVLGDLVHARAVLVVWCGACRREGRLAVLPVISKRGHGCGVRELGKVLTCAGFGRRGFADVQVEWI